MMAERIGNQPDKTALPKPPAHRPFGLKHSAPVGQPTVTKAIVPTSHTDGAGYTNTETMSASITGNHAMANVEKLAPTALVEFQSTPIIIKTEYEEEHQSDAEYSDFADGDPAHADGELSVQPVVKAEAEFDISVTTESDAENCKHAIVDAGDEDVDLSRSTVVMTDGDVDTSGIPARDGVNMDYTDTDEVDLSWSTVVKTDGDVDTSGIPARDGVNMDYTDADEVDLSWSTVVKTEGDVVMSGIPARDGDNMDYTDADEAEEENDLFMDDAGDYLQAGSEYELDSSTAIPRSKTAEQKMPKLVSTANEASVTAEGAVERSPSASPGPSNDDIRDYVEGNCPVPECRRPFNSLHPKGSLWHHLKYMMHRGKVGFEEFEAAHAKVHAEMKRATEPQVPKAERDKLAAAKYKRNNPEKAKRSARRSRFRAQAKKRGITDPQGIEDYVEERDSAWLEKNGQKQ